MSFRCPCARHCAAHAIHGEGDVNIAVGWFARRSSDEPVSLGARTVPCFHGLPLLFTERWTSSAMQLSGHEESLFRANIRINSPEFPGLFALAGPPRLSGRPPRNRDRCLVVSASNGGVGAMGRARASARLFLIGWLLRGSGDRASRVYDARADAHRSREGSAGAVSIADGRKWRRSGRGSRRAKLAGNPRRGLQRGRCIGRSL